MSLDAIAILLFKNKELNISVDEFSPEETPLSLEPIISLLKIFKSDSIESMASLPEFSIFKFSNLIFLDISTSIASKIEFFEL